jgi:hypothetical protein
MKTIPALFVCSLAVLIVACGKDRFETKPKLEVKDYNSKEIFQGMELRIRLNYFDKEGDLSEAPVIGIIKRLNLFPIPPTQDKVDTFRNNLPEFPKNDNGEISFQLPFDFLKESTVENDTILFRFAVTDKAGNTSDTIQTDPIVIHLP